MGRPRCVVFRRRGHDMVLPGAELPPPWSRRSPQNTFGCPLIWPLGLLDIFWLGRLLAESRKSADPGRRRVGGFALLFLARFPCIWP